MALHALKQQFSNYNRPPTPDSRGVELASKESADQKTQKVQKKVFTTEKKPTKEVTQPPTKKVTASSSTDPYSEYQPQLSFCQLQLSFCSFPSGPRY